MKKELKGFRTGFQQCTLFILLVLAGLLSHARADMEIPNYKAQLHSPIEWIQVPGTADQFYMAQRTTDGKLILTPNESFFPKLGLRAEGQGKVPDTDRRFNKGSSFETITRWDPGDQAEWGLWFEEAGDLTLRIGMSQEKTQSQFTVTLGNQTRPFEVKQSQVISAVSLTVTKPERHSLILTCSGKEANAKPKLHWIEVSGPATARSAVLRKRWRPAAAHTRFSSSQNPKDIRLWIMEMDARPGSLGFYSPITTPFGYFGPSWLANGQVNTRLNFSLWSYGRNKSEPPLEQLSHLVAIGNPDASFDGFGHEGTGVKIRNWAPLTNRQGQRQALALRVESGDPYDTYFSYFYAHDQKQWRLFGIGKKYNKHKPLETLWVGSFVEVPGRSSIQRTGPYERQMRYRGWVVGKEGELYPLDQMSIRNIDKSTGLTHTDRGVTEDGQFYLQTGGWIFRMGLPEKNVALTQQQSKTAADYLDTDDLSYLQTVPCEINGKSIQRTAEGVVVTFGIRNLGQDPKVKIFWSDREALTFADRWPNQVSVQNPLEGTNKVILHDVSNTTPIFVRLFLANQEGQFWSMDTLIPANH